MIDFELPPETKAAKKMIHALNMNVIRKISRKYDDYENEHERVVELKDMDGAKARGSLADDETKGEGKPKGPRVKGITYVVRAEEMAYGDAGLMLAIPGRGLGNAAIEAVATPEQKERFGKKYASMAITEPGCGSDSSAIRTTAVLDEKTN